MAAPDQNPEIDVPPQVELTIESIPDDLLGAIFAAACLEPSSRAKHLPLVCQRWCRVEKDFPCRPTALSLWPNELGRLGTSGRAFLTWHLRDTSRLQMVELGGGWLPSLLSKGYWAVVQHLMHQLATRAPALRCLRMHAPGQLASEPEDSAVEPAYPWPTMLLLIARLSQLESLMLIGFRYRAEDAVLITQLTQLRNLKELSLETITRWVPLHSLGDVLVAEFEVDIWHHLQDTIFSISQLTSLHLWEVDLIQEACVRLPTADDIHTLTTLRSLKYHSHYALELDVDVGMEVTTWFSIVAQMVNLTELNITCHDGAQFPDMLTNLSRLQELSLSSRQPRELVISSEAQLTKLNVNYQQAAVQDLQANRTWEDLLPLTSLENVKDLTIDCRNQIGNLEWIWPTTWGQQLTGLACLSLYLAAEQSIPRFFSDVKGLTEITVSVLWHTFYNAGVSYVPQLMDSLPKLTKLQIFVFDGEGGKLNQSALDTLDTFCERAAEMVPGLSLSFKAMDDYNRCITFTR